MHSNPKKMIHKKNRLSKRKKICCAVSLSLAAFFLISAIALLIAPATAKAAGTTTTTTTDENGNTTVVDNGNVSNGNANSSNQSLYNGDNYGTGDNTSNTGNPYTTPFEYSNDYGPTSGAPNASNNTTTDGRGFTLTFDGDNGTMTSTIRMFLVLTVISLAPSILVMLTSFTKIIVVLHFIRSALNTQTAPPNQVITGLALFLTLFIMWPTFQDINSNAIQPLDRGDITFEQAIPKAEEPLREFMYGQTQTKDVDLFCDIANVTYDDYDDVPFIILVPSFILSQLREAFIIGFLVYIPFIVIDMVVSSILMSMGMMMLPPSMISMPFKILLFILADGWNLIIGSLVKTFY
jgi:flagellar biosynthetic protein FliP